VPIDTLPDIGDELDGFGISLPIAVVEVIRLNLRIEDRNGLGQQLLAEPSQKMGKHFPMKAEADKADVAQDEFLDALLRAALGCGNQASLCCKREGRVALSEFSISCPAQNLLSIMRRGSFDVDDFFFGINAIDDSILVV